MILAALDSQTTNKVPRWGTSTGDFSAELWLNQVEMLRTMNKWTEEQTKEACFLSMEEATAMWKQAMLQDKGPKALATLAQFKEAFLKRLKKLKTPVAQLKQTSAETCLDFYDRCANSINKAHKEDLTQLANQPEGRESYQRAIKQTVWLHFVAGLHSNIKAQISAKLQSFDPKEKLLTTASEIQAAVRPKRSSSPHGGGPRDANREGQNPRDAKGDREPQPPARGGVGRCR